MENTEVKKEKLSYEELENVCHQLSEQSRSLYQRLQEANLSNMFKRLDYLFNIVKYKDSFSDEFVTKCRDEIITALTLPEEPENPEKKED